MKIIGIDYSMTSPAVAVYDPDRGPFEFKNVKCHFASSKKMHESYVHNNIWGTRFYPELWADDIRKYRWFANWAHRCFADDAFPVDDKTFTYSLKVIHLRLRVRYSTLPRILRSSKIKFWHMDLKSCRLL